jgi:hypothetical protein
MSTYRTICRWKPLKVTAKTSRNDRESINKTFRVKRSTIRRIESDASRSGISTNALVNNILSRYVEWDRVANEVGFVSLAPNMIHALLELSTEDIMFKAGERIATTSCFKDLSLHFFQQYDPGTFLKLALLLQKFGNNYKVQGERNENGGMDLSFYHDFGKKWSDFIGSLLHNELIRLRIEHTHEISDNAVVFKLSKHLEDKAF